VGEIVIPSTYKVMHDLQGLMYNCNYFLKVLSFPFFFFFDVEFQDDDKHYYGQITASYASTVSRDKSGFRYGI